MALSELKRLGDQAHEKFEIAAHRHSPPHRPSGDWRNECRDRRQRAPSSAAFEACEWAISELKRTVPIWKKEVFEDGEIWVEGEGAPVNYSIRRLHRFPGFNHRTNLRNPRILALLHLFRLFFGRRFNQRRARHLRPHRS